uniref:Ig-like domain-containing protein n=1 Tax=uncultured Methanobrevibacter sp. TaxID=253161 RepID=UPI002617C5D3
MKLNRFLLVSIFLLAILTFGAVSAAEDNATSGLTDVNDLDLAIQEVDEIEAAGGVDSDVAISDNVKDVEDSKLGASQEEVLKEPVNPTYTIDATDIKYGQVENVTVSIPGATGVVNMTCNNQVYSGTLIDGKITQQITNYVVGSNKLTVQYFGDDNYNPFTGTKNFRASFDYTIHDANFGQIAFIELNLYDATGTVTFNLNSGADVVDVDLVNGSIIKEYKNYNVFKNTIVITYNGDERFNANQVTSNSFQARPIITKETVYNGQPEIITINLGEATGIVNVTFNGEVTQCPLVNGIATFETTDYAIGTNKFTYSYSGDDTFNAFDYQNYQATFTVLDKENSTIYSIVYKTPQKNVIAICIPHGNGTVNVTINGKKEVLELVDGVAEYAINPDDEINEINVTYAGSHRLNPNNSTGFVTIKDNVVNNDNYMYYFNQIDGGKIFGFIEDGTTLDFQGSIINPDQTKMVYFDVSKPVNIISTTNDAYIDLNTTAGSLMGENPGNRFTVSYGGSWSNITGINFHNTQLWVFNTHHVVLDRVSNVIEDQRVGSGVGATSIRANSTWVTVKNSYFYTRNNGGSSSLVIAWADYCTFDNNTIVVEGNVGNMIYLTTYNVDIPSGVLANVYNNITNNRILAHDKSPAAICWGLVISGANNYVADNYIDYGGVGINQQWGQGSFINNTYTGNVLVGGASANFLPTSVVYNNTIEGTASTGANTVFFNNTVGKALTVGQNAEAYDNTAGGLTLSGAGSYVHDNVINGATTITQANIIVENNTFLGDNSIKINNANAKNVTFANNDVVGYIEFGNKNAKGNIITGNNITTSKNYAIDLKTYTGTETVITDNILSSNNGFGNAAINHKDDDTLVIDNYQSETAGINITADDIYVGQTAVFNITCNVTSVSEVSVLVNNKQYTVKLVDGKGSLEVEDLLANTYTVRVSSLDETYGAQNSTTFTVSKNDCPEIVVDAPEKTQWIASDITVTIADATGTVKLSINGTDVSADLVDGVAVLAVPDLAAGEYNFTIAYVGDYKYLGNQTNGTLKVNKNKEVKIIASDVT